MHLFFTIQCHIIFTWPSVSCSGECLVYGFDDLTGALQLSHKLVLSSKDYPGILYTTMNCQIWTIICSQTIMALNN